MSFSKIKDEVIKIIEDILNKKLTGKRYVQSEAKGYCQEIVNEVLKELSKEFQGMKFFTYVTIAKKGGGSLHSGSSCCWNPETDGSKVIKFENDYFSTFVGIFGLAA